MDNWSQDTLNDYASRWPELKREIVFKQIIDGTLLHAALETDVGKHVLKDPVMLMSDSVVSLIEMCRAPDENHSKIVEQARLINVCEEVLKRWANTLAVEKQHREEAKKRR